MRHNEHRARPRTRSPFRLGAIGVALALAVGAVAGQEPGDVPEGAPAEDPRPTKQVKLYAENWKWTPNLIRVPKGTRLVLEVHSYDAPHAFELKAYKLKVPLPEDQTTVIEFVVDRAGEFPWRCGRPCGNGCPKMRGKLIVEE